MENLGSLLQIPHPLSQQDFSKHNSHHSFPDSTGFMETLLSSHSSLILQIFSHSVFELLHLRSGRLTPTLTPFHLFILLVSAPTEAWTTSFKVTAPKSLCHIAVVIFFMTPISTQVLFIIFMAVPSPGVNSSTVYVSLGHCCVLGV